MKKLMKKIKEKIFPLSKTYKEYKKLSNLYNHLMSEAFKYIRDNHNVSMRAYVKYGDHINYITAMGMGNYNGICMEEKIHRLNKQISYIEKYMHDIPAIRAELREIKLTELTEEV